MIKEILAMAATVLVSASYIPQIAQAYRTKKMQDVSMGFLLIISLGLLCWIAYAVLNKDLVFFVANLMIISFAAILLLMKVKYDKLY